MPTDEDGEFWMRRRWIIDAVVTKDGDQDAVAWGSFRVSAILA
jgi:hypothetical protein